MNKKIREPIQKNTKTYSKDERVREAEKKGYKTWNREYDDKNIIEFPPMIGFLMMIFMEFPQKTMHDVFVRKPSHTFHSNKRNHYSKNAHADTHGVEFVLMYFKISFLNASFFMEAILLLIKFLSSVLFLL